MSGASASGGPAGRAVFTEPRQAGILARLVSDRAVTAVIIFNTLLLFLQAFPVIARGWRGDFLFAVDYACTVFFVFELVAKVRVLSWRGYWSSAWNRFDAVVVIAAAPMLLAPLLDVKSFAALLLLRTARMLRVLRALRFIPDADRLWQGIQRALRASIGVLLALALYNFVMGLAACYLFGAVAPEYFDNPLIAIYSLFKVFTVEGWYEIPDAIAAAAGPGLAAVARAFFVFTVVTGGLLGLSLANAVFVDEMVMDNNAGLEASVAELTREVARLREDSASRSDALARRLDALAERGAGAGRDVSEAGATPEVPV